MGLDYDQTKAAPLVGIKGSAALADLVVRTARRFGIPVVENDTLAAALSCLQLNEEIPQRLFEAVAIVLQTLEQGDR